MNTEMQKAKYVMWVIDSVSQCVKKSTNLEGRINNNTEYRVEQWKDWVQKKNGHYGYVSKQQTTYRCSGSAVDVGQSSPIWVKIYLGKTL